MADLEGLDVAALEEKMKAAESYEDRAAIRKALREIKKKQGLQVGGNKTRGSSQYNRFAGGTTKSTSKVIPQSFVPSSSPVPPTTTTSTPPPLPSTRTPSPPPLPSPSDDSRSEEMEREKEEERKRKEEREREERERERIEREEIEREKREREERERERIEREEIEREKREREERERQEKERQKNEKEQKEREERERERKEREREREEREREREERRRQRELEREERAREAQEKEKEKREKEREEREREREERQRKLQEQEERERGVEGEDEEEEDEQEIDPQNTDQSTVSDEGQDTTDGPYGGSTRGGRLPPSTKPQDTEFQKLQLRKTASGGGGGGVKSSQVNTHDFGVKLKPRPQEAPPTTNKSSTTTQQGSSWKSSSATPPSTRKGGGGAPRTLADFQKLANRGKQTDTPPSTTTTSRTDKKTLILSYVNAALEVRPPISSDHALYQLCSRPSNLCKLINKSVRNTVDLRALTKTPPPSASSADKAEAMEENMILVVESARSIGCSVTEDMEQLLAEGDRNAVDKLLIELIKSRVVHMPGMEDEPSSTFNDLSTLMSKLGLTPPPQEDIDQGEGGGKGEGEGLTWKERDSQRLREKLASEDSGDRQQKSETSSTWREDRNKKTPEIDLNKPSFDVELSYEERAAIRRAEREKRKREREGYATPK